MRHPGVRETTDIEVVHPSMLSSLVENLQRGPTFRQTYSVIKKIVINFMCLLVCF